MDRITKSYLNEFRTKFDFSKEIAQDVLFEHFVNYTLLDKKVDESFDEETIEKLNIGKNGTIGIDGFTILINGHLIFNKEDVDLILDKNKKSNAEVYFIQSKTSTNFDNNEIASFGNAIIDFISEEHNYMWNYNANEKIDLFSHLISRVTDLAETPKCFLYFVCLGKNNEDKNINATKTKILNDINSQRIFKTVSLNYVDYTNLQNEYKKIGQNIFKTFNFPFRTLIPEIDKVKEAYIGVVPVTTIVKLITDDDENLISTIFYDNVRDYQGLNKINKEIRKTIDNEKLKYAFSVLNNGITIVADKLTPLRTDVTIHNYQIINGLQTSHVLFNCKELLDDKIFVPLKLIITQDEILISKIIRSTNRQTEVKEEDLIAYSDFQKRLEDYYKTFNEKEKLYYERRSKQYNNTQIDRKNIIDKSTQIKVIGSMFFYKPNMATRFFGALFNEFGKELFSKNHKMLPYYTSSYTFNRLEGLFKANFIDKKYKKIKFFILMMIKFEIDTSKCPSFESNKSENFCNTILSKVNNEVEFKIIEKNVLKKIDSLQLDLTDNEISKSAKLVEDCKKFYF